jgi:hypothetical protein
MNHIFVQKLDASKGKQLSRENRAVQRRLQSAVCNEDFGDILKFNKLRVRLEIFYLVFLGIISRNNRSFCAIGPGNTSQLKSPIGQYCLTERFRLPWEVKWMLGDSLLYRSNIYPRLKDSTDFNNMFTLVPEVFWSAESAEERAKRWARSAGGATRLHSARRVLLPTRSYRIRSYLIRQENLWDQGTTCWTMLLNDVGTARPYKWDNLFVPIFIKYIFSFRFVKSSWNSPSLQSTTGVWLRLSRSPRTRWS